jgi:MFS-type transporter involved in bile tolerance (Atg22 family)
MGYEGSTASRFGIVSVAVLFLAGGLILSFVDEDRGKEERRYLSGL